MHPHSNLELMENLITDFNLQYAGTFTGLLADSALRSRAKCKKKQTVHFLFDLTECARTCPLAGGAEVINAGIKGCVREH